MGQTPVLQAVVKQQQVSTGCNGSLATRDPITADPHRHIRQSRADLQSLVPRLGRIVSNQNPSWQTSSSPIAA
jgi:hypothetical protein